MDSNHAALIARLEAASEGSRELDKEIGSALGWRYRHVDGYLQYIAGDRWDGPSGVTLGDLPRWSTSLDDALAHVVPEGWVVATISRFDTRASTKVAYPRQATGVQLLHQQRGLIVRGEHVGTTSEDMALALCIASLRALQAMSEGEG